MGGRITVVESVYYALDGRDPVECHGEYSAKTMSDQQPYVKQITVGEDWMPIDLGWLRSVGEIHVANRAGTGLQKVPTDAERAVTNAKVLQIAGYGNVPIALARAGRTARFEPCDATTLKIRCLCGETECIVSLFPG